MFRKSLSVILTALMLLLAVACSPPGDRDVPPVIPEESGGLQVPGTGVIPEEDTDTRKVRISISVKRSGSSQSRAIAGTGKNTVLDSSYIRDDIKGKQPVETITPRYFIMNIPELTVYQAQDGQDAEKGSSEDFNVMKRATGDTMNMVNFLTDRGVPGLEITDANSEFFNRTWNGIYMHCSGFQGGFNPVKGYDHYYGGSFIGVKLPDNMKISDVVNARPAESFENGNFFLDDSVAWFSWNDLNPINAEMVDSICFQKGLKGVGVINPDGLREPADGRPCWQAGPRSWTGGVSCLTIPLDADLDFRGRGIPEIEIEYDTENLITLYEIGENQYRATFNVENPYPFSIEVDEWHPEERIVLNASQKEEDIREARLMGALYARRPDGIGLTYIKPNYEDIDHIEIWHATENDISKSECIYAGLDNSYMHKVEDVFSPHYYWGVTVNDDGERSYAVQFLRSRIGDNYHYPDEGEGEGGGGPEKEEIKNGSVSMTVGTVSAHQPSDAGDVFRNNIKSDNASFITGKPAMKLTPTSFRTTVGQVVVYALKDPNDIHSGVSNGAYTSLDTGDLSPNIDLLDKDTSISLTLDPEGTDLRNDAWDGIALDVNYGYNPRNGRGTAIGLPLPEGCSADSFENALRKEELQSNPQFDGKNEGYVWFSLQSLIPTPGFSIQQFLFQKGIEKGTYLNPKGENLTGWNGPFELRNDNRSCAVVRMEQAPDFSDAAVDSIEIALDPTDLIWCYEVEKGLYRAVLNLDDPFPLTMTVKSSGK